MVMSREFYRELTSLRESATADGSPEALEQLGRDVTRMVEHDAADISDVSVARVFEATVEDGREARAQMDPNFRGSQRFRESADVVNTSLFAHTMGQIIYTQMLDAYQSPELIGDRLVTKMVTQFSGEKLPGVSEIGDEVEIVNEGQPYPRALVGEYFIETPETIKRGLIVDVTKEAIFFDRTNLILQRASGVGKYIGINREKRILDVVLGISTVYKRNGAAAAATYQAANTLTSTALVDWDSIDDANVKFAAQTDPDTGEPIVVTPNTLVVPPALKMLAGRIQNATMTGQTTSGNETRVSGNSLEVPFSIESNQYVKERTSSDTSWFYGNPTAAFAYMENFPLTVITNTENDYASFERDVVAQSKASERGAAAVIERRYMMKVTA